MATIDYSRRLANLRQRKYDQVLNESRLSKSFSSNDIPDNVKYLLESMRSLEQAYTAKSHDAGNRVRGHLENGFNLHFNVAYHKQGSISTDTNIRIFSDIDLLSIIDKYHYLPEGQESESPYRDSDPNKDIVEMRRQGVDILSDIYDEVDTSGAKSIWVRNKSLNRKVDVVFAYWHNSRKFQETGDQYYRGIHLYDFHLGKRITTPDYPFAHIHSVNYKGDQTDDGSRKGIRFLKTLKVDHKTEQDRSIEVDLSSFQLTTIVHAIADNALSGFHRNELSIAKAVSSELDKMISDQEYRRLVKSPNGTEFPLQDSSLVDELVLLKIDLDVLIEDCENELRSNILQKAIIGY